MSAPRTAAEAHAMTLEPADLAARCVVYLILCATNGKGYVGQTRGTVRGRRFEHSRGYRDISGGPRDHCPVLNAAFRKHGWDAFTFYMIEVCTSSDELNDREPFWINKLGTLAPNGYNLKTGGSASPLPESAKIKLSIANKGKKMSPEAIEKTRQANLGREKSNEERQKISDGVHRRDYRHSAEIKAKISAAGMGRRMPNHILSV